jgi:hypothetical protein
MEMLLGDFISTFSVLVIGPLLALTNKEILELSFSCGAPKIIF